MIEASIGRGPTANELPQEVNAQNGEAPASRTPDSGKSHDRTGSEPTPQPPTTPVSIRKIDANRRNASQSTGPKTEAGKRASRLNAVTHGLLAKAVVITAGDYQEDEREFGQLLEELREQFAPVGVAEDLEVQKIAFCYWRTMRAVRYEHGAIRKRTGDMRGREQRRREEHVASALQVGANLELSAWGIQYLLFNLGRVEQEVLDGQPLSTETHAWLEAQFPGEFAASENTPDDGRQLADKLDEQLRRLSRLWKKVAATEKLDLDSKLRAAALPGPEAVANLTRYETSNDRELDRALKRLEQMQERRRATGGTHPTT